MTKKKMVDSSGKVQETLFDGLDIESQEQRGKAGRINNLPEHLAAYGETDDLAELKKNIVVMRNSIQLLQTDRGGYIKIQENGRSIDIRKDVLVSELDQIIESHTLPRASYYLTRLIRSFNVSKVSKINDIKHCLASLIDRKKISHRCPGCGD